MSSIAYSSGINRLVSILPNNRSGAYSDNDGITWNLMDLGATRNWSNIFVTHSGQTPFFIITTSGNTDSQNGLRSSDGINWTGFQMLPLVTSSNCSWNNVDSIDNHIIVLPYDTKNVSSASYVGAPYFYSYDYGAIWNSGTSPRIPGYLGQTATNCITSVDRSGQKYFIVQSQMIGYPFYASGFKIDYNANNPTGFINHPKFSAFQYPTAGFPAFKYSNQDLIFTENIYGPNSGYISSNTGQNWSTFNLLEEIDTLDYNSGLWIGLRLKRKDQYDNVRYNFLLSGNDSLYPSYPSWRYDSLPLINNDNDYKDIIFAKDKLFLLSSSGYKKIAKGTVTKNYYKKSKYINTATLNGDSTNRSFGNRVYIENNTALIVGVSGNTANFIPTGIYNVSIKSGITWTDKIRLNITGTCRLYPNCAALNENQNIIFIPSAINTGNGCRTSVSILTGSGQNWQHISNINSITNAENIISSIAVNKNANRLAVGIPSVNSNSGAVYVYSGNVNNWNLMTTLTGGNSYFGESISFNDSGDILAVSASAAFNPSGGVFIFTGQTNWSISSRITGTTFTTIGSFVGLNNSGNVLATCGIYGGGSYIGNAEVFTGSSNNWGLSNVIKNNNYAQYNGIFGAFNTSGNLFFMGGGGSLTAPISLSEKYGDKWIHHTNFTGTSININNDGSRIIVGNLYKYDPIGGFPFGSVDIYEKD